MGSTRRIPFAFLALAMLNVSGLAMAQESAPEQQAFALEEIVVTAQRRAENLQEVPIAVSVHTGDELEALGLNGVGALVDVTPGLVMNNVAGFSNPYIRGVGANTGTIGNDVPVATYVNGAYFSEKISTTLYDFLDIERVEVLKGPQGTLFGRNATGGAINIVTRNPTEEFSAQLEATYANFNDRGLRGYLAGSLSDQLLASVAFGYKRSDGYIDNVIPTNGFSDEDVGETESESLRIKLLWDASETVTVNFSADYMDALNRAG